jgi:hypothetical protein
MKPVSTVKLARPELTSLAPVERRRRWPWFILKAVVSIGLIFWVLSRAQLADVLQALGRVDSRFLILAFDLELTGFETAEIDLLIEQVNATPDPADEVPDVPAGEAVVLVLAVGLSARDGGASPLPLAPS